jgi:hypothetical protein
MHNHIEINLIYWRNLRKIYAYNRYNTHLHNKGNR